MRWSCVVRINKYCNGAPEWEKEPMEVKPNGEATGWLSGGTCKLNPETCGKCVSIVEQITPEELERISKPTFVEKIIPIKEANSENGKAKSVKAKKLEQEMSQRSMF